MLEHPVHVLAVLLVTLAALFQLNRTALGARVFGIVPLLVFAYFVPAARFVSDLGMPVVALLAPRPGERILDLGCGDGALRNR
jgi:hypothetical protein